MASKLYDADNAYAWAISLFGPDVGHGDATISEMVWDAHDFKRTPEIAAHGGLVCALAEMLVDPDTESPIDVFPGIPLTWFDEGVGFQKILIKGAPLFRRRPTRRLARLWPWRILANSPLRGTEGITTLADAPDGTRVENGWAILEGIDIPALSRIEEAFAFRGSEGEGEDPYQRRLWTESFVFRPLFLG